MPKRNGLAATAQRGRQWVPYAAACWALIFGVFHIVWAAGWYVGLDAEQARTAFANPWLMAYDVAVVFMCIVAVPLSLAIGMGWRLRFPPRVLDVLAWTGTGLLVLRATASLIQAAYLLATGRFVLRQMGIWEPWFYLGAVLFGVNLWHYWRRPRASAA